MLRRSLLTGALCVLGLAPPASSRAADLVAEVVSHKGDAVIDAVVYAAQPGAAASKAASGERVIDQIDKEFVPQVSAVLVGTPIRFPNHDQIRHHVYSFSPAKKFEIPLYKGIPAEPIVFDRAGIVTLGCNIHDWMSGYIFVSETPHFAITDENGHAELSGLAPGEYEVRVWHPNMKKKPDNTLQKLSIAAASDSPALQFKLETKRVWRPRRGGGGGSSRYR